MFKDLPDRPEKFDDFVALLQEQSRSDAPFGHKRHVLCSCPSPRFTFNHELLPAEIWAEIFTYLDFYDLSNIKSLNRFLRACSRVRSSRETRFTAPLDELSWKDVKAGDEFELHPAFDRFLCAMKKEETLQPSSSTRSQEANLGSSVIREGFRYSKEFRVGRKGYDKLTDLQTQNATRPPTNRIRLMFTEWTKKSIRHFCRNHELYSFDWRYGYELKLPSMKIQDSSKLISGYSMPQSGTLVDEISDVITVGDLMELLEAIHRDPYEYAHLNSRWTQLDHLQDYMGCWLEWQSEREFLEEVIEDDGWGSRVNWEDHFKGLRQDQYNRLKEKFTLENPPGTARLVLPTRESKPFKVGIDQSNELIMNLDGGEIYNSRSIPC